MSARAEHARTLLRRSARATTGSERRSPSARTHGGGGSSSPASPSTPGTCSTWPPARASSRPGCTTEAFASRASTRAPRCSRGRAHGSRTGSSSSKAQPTQLPFADAAFDHLTFTYLLRYVDDPAATLAELARVVRPGGTIAMLEFGLPRGVWRPRLGSLGRRRAAARRQAHLAGLARGGPLPWPLDSCLSRGVSRGAPTRALGRRGDRRQRRPPAEPRRRARRLGTPRCEDSNDLLQAPRPAFYALGPAGGATT